MANPKTLRELLSLSQEDRKVACKPNGNIDKVIIDGVEFTDYKAFSFLWEKTYAKSPVRAQGNGAITNLNSYSTFLTAHLKIDFSLLSIDSYRAIMKLIYSKNEFNVTCYDIVYDRDVTVKMYFATEEMPKLLALARRLNGEDYIELLGVQEYTVEMIGTNAEEGDVSIIYHRKDLPNSQGQTIVDADTTGGSDTFPKGTEIVIENYTSLFSLPSGYEFVHWVTINEKGELKPYEQGGVYNEYEDLVLYPVYKSTQEYTLTFNYGIGEPQYSISGLLSNIQIKSGQSYEKAIELANITMVSTGKKLMDFPNSPIPSVTYQHDVYKDDQAPYIFRGWYATSTIPTGGKALTLEDTYKIAGNGTIYQIFQPKQFTVTYDSNGGTAIPSVTADYGSSVTAYTPVKAGYTFGGWYIDVDFNTRFDNTIPPKDITVYAKWTQA